MCVRLYMEAIQSEIHRIKNDLEDLQIKNNLLKMEYSKVKEQNKRLKKLIKEINEKVSTYIEE